MTALARLLEQRSVGHVHLRMKHDGVAIMREAGSAKCRLPRGSTEAILINTSGGLAGGDVVEIKAEVGENAALTLTSQTAERIYRTLGPAAELRVTLQAGAGARLLWLPQESIFFEGSALERTVDVEMAEDATFLGVEAMVFGRQEMGEAVRHVSVSDHWRIRRGEKLIHAEAFRLGPEWTDSPATFGESRAIATLVLVSEGAGQHIDKVRATLGPLDGASAWNGKLVARLLAKDGFTLRKTLIQTLRACLGPQDMPKTWTF